MRLTLHRIPETNVIKLLQKKQEKTLKLVIGVVTNLFQGFIITFFMRNSEINS